MNCTTCHTSGTNEPITRPRAICHGRHYMPLWLSLLSASWRKSKFLVSEFPLVTQLDWALNYLFVRLPMLLLRLQKSGKNGISTFLRFPLHREYQRTTTGYSPRCSCLAGNWGYLLTQWQPNFPFKHRGAYPLANLDWGSKSALHRNNRLITLPLSRTVWRDGWREIGRPTSEGCLRYTLRRWYRYLWKASLSNMGITSKRELYETVNTNKPVKWIRS